MTKKPCEEFIQARRRLRRSRHHDRRPINKRKDPKEYKETHFPQETEGSTQT